MKINLERFAYKRTDGLSEPRGSYRVTSRGTMVNAARPDAIRYHIDTVTAPNGNTIQQQWVEIGSGVMVLPFDANHTLYLVHEESYAHGGKSILALPGGVINPDEPAVHAAGREAEEELGLVLKHFTYLGISTALPNRVFHKAHTFIAKVVGETAMRHEVDEHIERVKLPLSTALDWIDKNRITEPTTASTIQILDRRLRRQEFKQ